MTDELPHGCGVEPEQVGALATHFPAEQVDVDGHAVPQPPQLFRSVRKLTHTLPHKPGIEPEQVTRSAPLIKAQTLDEHKIQLCAAQLNESVLTLHVSYTYVEVTIWFCENCETKLKEEVNVSIR